MLDSGFNPKLLLLARQFRDMSQQDVAEKAGFNQGHYSKIEGGLLVGSPPSESIVQIAKALSFPTDFFYQGDDTAAAPVSAHAFNRKKNSVTDSGLKRLYAEFNIRALHIRRLLRATEIESVSPRPEIHVDAGGGPREIARTIRRAWRIPPGPIDNLTAYAERAGIFVIEFDFEEPVDGVTMFFSDLPPCIFLNKRAPADRMRFSLAHEIGHVIMHRKEFISSEEIEHEANVFAAELLCPEREIRVDLIGDVSIEKLARLKARWKVSMQFLVMQAKEIGCINSYESQNFWRLFSRMGWKTKEPVETEFAHEKAQLFPRLITLHTEDLNYSESEFAALLYSNVDDARKLYGNVGASKQMATLHLIKS